MKGVDVSVGGFASRAGHPPLAEVALALHDLYGITLDNFQYNKLYQLSRQLEQTYGLMECPTQPVTGIITHSIYSSSRNEILEKAPNIYDVIDTNFIGSKLNKGFGVRSGVDGIYWFLKKNSEKLKPLKLAINQDSAKKIFSLIVNEWHSRSKNLLSEQKMIISQYSQSLNSAFFTEEQMMEFINEQKKSRKID